MSDALREEVGRVRAWYNLVADAFVGRYAGASGWYLARCEEDLLHSVCPLAGRRVLDLGTGAGRLLPRLAAVAGHVVGADISEALLARSPRSPRAALVQLNALDLAFGPSSFDTVVALGLFEYVGELERFLPEIARVLRPAGVLAFTYHQIAAYRRPVDESPDAPYFGRTVAERSRYWAKRRHRGSDVRASLTRAGFVRVRGYRLFFRLPRALFALSERLGPGAGLRAAAREGGRLLERALARGLRPVTSGSTGNVLVVAERAA
jgi:SAM-dependent methyltransferase